MVHGKTRKAVVVDTHMTRIHGSAPTYKKTRNQDAQNIDSAITPAVAPCTGTQGIPPVSTEPEIQTQLDLLDVGSDSESGNDEDELTDDDEDAPLASISVPIISFDEIVQDLNETELDNENGGDGDGDGDEVGTDNDRLLENLFDYPSLSDPNSQTFSFMTAFWNKGEENLHTEVTLHETIISSLPLDNSDTDSEGPDDLADA
ncbi:hypothetical protein VKT23_019597 [Stygiomarasmius scandens]|uniref:Uncharacterized protein n=1 Tax=Marasmiellus scandens TaxID=2682957 RepID=A0ABR1IKZ4_9AGAR